MDEKIIALLQCTEHQYEMTVFNHYLWWCELNAFSDGDLQRVVANAQINKWFLVEYRKHQKSFLEKAGPYMGLGSAQDMYDLYKDETKKIKDYYPKPLLYSVRHKKYAIYGQSNSN